MRCVTVTYLPATAWTDHDHGTRQLVLTDRIECDDYLDNLLSVVCPVPSNKVSMPHQICVVHAVALYALLGAHQDDHARGGVFSCTIGAVWRQQ